jgi:hypothetical protein
MRPTLQRSAAAALLCLAGCGDPGPTGWIVDREGEPPAQLSEWGIYPSMDPAELSTIAQGYEPRHPLWSNGTRKHRAFVLPEGAAIDNADPERWVFPTGTLLFKTFSDDDGPVETRVVTIEADGWSYRVFRWNAEGTEATEANIDRDEEVELTIDGEPAMHGIPSRRQCVTCHESAPAVWLGFGALQRSAELMSTLEADGALAAPPAALPTIDTGDAASDSVVGYFQGNCVHCHNGIAGPANSFDLGADVAIANIVDVPTGSSAAEAGTRVVPGAAEESVLFRSFAGLNELAMPPVGVSERDEAMVAELRAWIEGLE